MFVNLFLCFFDRHLNQAQIIFVAIFKKIWYNMYSKKCGVKIMIQQNSKKLGYKDEEIIDAKKFLETFTLTTREKPVTVSESTRELLRQMYALFYFEYRVLDEKGKLQPIPKKIKSTKDLIEMIAKKDSRFVDVTQKFDQLTTQKLKRWSNYCDSLIQETIEGCKALQDEITGFDFYLNYKPAQFKKLENILADSYKEQDALEKSYKDCKKITLLKRVKVTNKIKAMFSKPNEPIKTINER